MAIVKNIFQELVDTFGETICDLDIADTFFSEFMNKTQGAVVVDFLDTDNWDKICGYETDKGNGLLKLYFRLPCKNQEEKLLRQMAFPFDYYSMVLKFKSLEFLFDKNRCCLGFVVNGYTVTEKNVRRYIKSDGWVEKCLESGSSFFSLDFLREKNGLYECSRFLTTPITSFGVFPKTLNINTEDSKELLYHYNIDKFIVTLKKADEKLREIISAQHTRDEKEEELKNVGNGVRRIAEKLFKLMLCYYKERCLIKKKDYNMMLLGDLTSPLKKYVLRGKDDEKRMSEITSIANDLSHDTGNPVNPQDVELLLKNIEYYIEYFQTKVESRDNVKPIETADTLPSPKEYIQNNFRSFNFSNEIIANVTLSSAPISYKIQIECEPLNQSWFKNEHDWLCKDGSIKRLSQDDESEALKIYGRKEAIALCKAIHLRLVEECNRQGLDTECVSFYFGMFPQLHREGKPTYLFTEDDIKNLMVNADDSQNNKLVIDEDGHACLVNDIGDAGFYPVSQETWCAGNGYVGPNSKLTDLHDSYVLSLHSWLAYLQSGNRVYDDYFVSDEGLDKIIEEIKKYY